MFAFIPDHTGIKTSQLIKITQTAGILPPHTYTNKQIHIVRNNLAVHVGGLSPTAVIALPGVC